MLEITLFWALFCLPGCCEGFATFSVLALVWRLWSKTPSTFPEARITWMVPLQVSSRNGLEPGTPDKSRGATRRMDGRTDVLLVSLHRASTLGPSGSSNIWKTWRSTRNNSGLHKHSLYLCNISENKTSVRWKESVALSNLCVCVCVKHE